MDNSLKFREFREKYKEFHYNKYSISEDDKCIYLDFEFEIIGLKKFFPKVTILKKNNLFKDKEAVIKNNLVFHIGMIELLSYWKCTCSPKIVIHCGYLSEEQINWWKKLYFYGLGELFYLNNIKTNFDDFVCFECLNKEQFSYNKVVDNFSGYIVPIGGGKDSVVTLENLDIDKNRDYCLIVNPKSVTLECARIAGFKSENIIEIYRNIDEGLLELNNEGFINGHTPFSAMLAFLSYFVSYLFSKKYIALSNESSANECNVLGEKINHQYSKSFEFECDFTDYSKKYLKMPIKYFSFLRPLNELQIAKLFSRYEKYHLVFKSCNVGSKNKEWNWCCNCSKCLFAYIILSPYLYKDRLVKIFGEDLFSKMSLLDVFIQLTGNGEFKPFDCVGTFEEVNFAINETIRNILSKNLDLPYLLEYYKINYGLIDYKEDITKRFDKNNNLDKFQEDILRKELF